MALKSTTGIKLPMKCVEANKLQLNSIANKGKTKLLFISNGQLCKTGAKVSTRTLETNYAGKDSLVIKRLLNDTINLKTS